MQIAIIGLGKMGGNMVKPTIAASLFARFSSRQDNSFAMRVLSALRNEFGGHAVKKA